MESDYPLSDYPPFTSPINSYDSISGGGGGIPEPNTNT